MNDQAPTTRPDRTRVLIRVIHLIFIFIGLAACTAHYPVNTPLTSAATVEAYSVRKETQLNRSNELLLVLTFSGGGTRAAAFSYGILKALADTKVVIDGEQRRLIDEVDAISSVSGGSFTAAYYGLFGDRIFEDFESKFLKKNVQSELAWRVLSPAYWPKLASLYYDRSDLAADYYDELLFEKKTFQDIFSSGGPIVGINATNISLGSQFTFVGAQFAPICTDLLSYPVSRAVTASSAVPGAFSSIIIKNYAGSCDYQMPEWATRALGEKSHTSRRYQQAKELNEYLDSEKQPYIHLLDGGISDNLGVRPFINATMNERNLWKKLKEIDLENTSKLVVITMSAETELGVKYNKRDYSVPLIDSLGAASSVPLSQYSYETMELLRNNMNSWESAITAGRCREAQSLKGETTMKNPKANASCAAKTYLIEVDFHGLKEESERQYLSKLPTSFYLEPGDVDRLIEAARQILDDSETFQSLVSDLQR
jgi:NTE family protein